VAQEDRLIGTEMPIRSVTEEESGAWARKIVPQAFAEVVRPCTTAIIAETVDGTKIGSGVLLEISESCFLISAAHVFDYYVIQKAPIYVPRSPEPTVPILLDKVEYYVSPVPAHRKADDPDMREDDPFDVGVCRLPKEISTVLKEHFRFLRLCDVNAVPPRAKGAYMVAGYPGKLVEVLNGGKRLMPTPLLAVANLRDTLPEETRLIKNESIFMSISVLGLNQQYEEVKLPPLQGISGCGMWRLANPARFIDMWKPEDIRLVGIETSCLRTEYIRGISMSIVLAMIGYCWPSLRDPINLIYPSLDVEVPLPNFMRLQPPRVE
jgi:hypothetical protein